MGKMCLLPAVWMKKGPVQLKSMFGTEYRPENKKSFLNVFLNTKKITTPLLMLGWDHTEDRWTRKPYYLSSPHLQCPWGYTNDIVLLPCTNNIEGTIFHGDPLY